MRGPAKPATGDLIVEPIEEAVALYDDLLKELQKFMVSHLFLGYFSSARIEQIRTPSKVDEIALFPISKKTTPSFLPVNFPAVSRNFI
jgi:hypothetical protein